MPTIPVTGSVTLRDLAVSQRRPVLAALLISLAGSGAVLVQPVLVRTAVQEAGDPGQLLRSASWLALFLAAGALTSAVESAVLMRAGEELVCLLRERLVRHALHLPAAYYTEQSSAEVLSRVSSDTVLLKVMATTCLVDLASGSVTLVAALGGMLLVDPVLLVLAVVAVVLVTLVAVVTTAPVRRCIEESQRRLGLLSSCLERALTAIRTIQVANAEDDEYRAASGLARQVRGSGVRAGVMLAASSAVVMMVVQAGVLLVLGAGAVRVRSGALSLGDLVAFAMLLMILISPLGRVAQAVGEIQVGRGALTRINDLLAVPVQEDGVPASSVPGRPTAVVPEGEPAPAAGAGAAAVAPRPRGALGRAAALLQVQGLSLEYGGGAVQALRGVSFTVRPGTTTAVVGRSGAGKTSLLSVLVRLYDPSAGTVLVEGTDFRQLSRRELREMIGYVEQDAPVLDGSIRDNLLLGGVVASDEEIMETLRAVSLHDVVARVPEGLGASVGQRGLLLSGGQRQRLAIARALLRRPRLLILDEPTSNLDSLSESLVQSVCTPASTADTAVIVAAHRLSTVMTADSIVVLDDGRLVGQGDHHTLLRSCEQYRALVAPGTGAATP